MLKVYVPVKLDYDDYEVGSPGPMFLSQEAAEQYRRDNPYFTTVKEKTVWQDVAEHELWLWGAGGKRSPQRTGKG